MPLEVIGVGFGRTGTLSLKRALEELGLGPTCHMEEVSGPFAHPAMVLYARTNTIDWDTAVADFRSGVDFPSAACGRSSRRATRTPRSFLTVRDPLAWWESTASTIRRVRTMFPRWLVRSCPITGRWSSRDGSRDVASTGRTSAATGLLDPHT